MSNSKYVTYTKLSPNYWERVNPISKITIHHMAVVNGTLEGVGNSFAKKSTSASANYGIDSEGNVALYVPEEKAAWTSSNKANDLIAVTIEVANSGGAPDWPVSDKAYKRLIDLCVDICERNGISALNYTGDASGNLTRHNMFIATTCPGPYLQARFPQIAEEVNARLKGNSAEVEELYRVQLGAFKSLDNAERLLAKAKEYASDAFMVEYEGMYKVQVGAFRNMINAEALANKMKASGFSVYITTASGKAVSASQGTSIAVGDTVSIVDGEKDYNGNSLASFVYKRNYVVKEISGDRVVITYGGVVVAAMKLSSLVLVRKG